MFKIPDVTPGETSDQWLARVVPLIPAEDVLRAVVAYVYRNRDMDGLAWFLSQATANGSGISWALARRFLPEGTVYVGKECEECDENGEEECCDCGGVGTIDEGPCEECGGSGKTECMDCGGTKKVNGDL